MHELSSPQHTSVKEPRVGEICGALHYGVSHSQVVVLGHQTPEIITTLVGQLNCRHRDNARFTFPAVDVSNNAKIHLK